MQRILAIDVGVRCGFARFACDPDSGLVLEWFQARNLGNRSRMRRAVGAILHEQPALTGLVLEGGGELADLWVREAARLNLPVTVVSAETWRRDLLLPRQQTDGGTAKKAAIAMASKIIAAHGTTAATKLRTDAAEAVLVGYWYHTLDFRS